jgi:hypothetical protein
MTARRYRTLVLVESNQFSRTGSAKYSHPNSSQSGSKAIHRPSLVTRRWNKRRLAAWNWLVPMTPSVSPSWSLEQSSTVRFLFRRDAARLRLSSPSAGYGRSILLGLGFVWLATCAAAAKTSRRGGYLKWCLKTRQSSAESMAATAARVAVTEDEVRP